MRIPTPLLAALALLLAGCQASNPPVPRRAIPEAQKALETQGEDSSPAPATTPEEAGETSVTRPKPASAAAKPADAARIPVARIGDQEISLAELLTTWVFTDSPGVRDMLERLVSSRLVAMESTRIGLELETGQVRAAYAEALTEREEQLRLRYPEMDLDRWIQEVLGLDPMEYRAHLEDDVRRMLCAERVVRTFTYSHEWAEVRVIVVETQEAIQAAVERIQAGEPFARLAAEVSIDPGGKNGGSIPPVLRSDSDVGRLVFDTKVGELGGPILEGGLWMVFQTDEIHAPLLGDWGEIAPKIEASLEERPIEDPEYWMWKREMQDRHPFDLGPFFDLVRSPGQE